MSKVKSKLSGTKNIPPLYAPNIPTGDSPYKKTSAISRPSTGAKLTAAKNVPQVRWGGATRGGSKSTIPPTGTNK